MTTTQLLCSQRFDTQMEVHTATQNTNVSLAQEFQKYLSNEPQKHDIIDKGKQKKGQVKKLDK